MSMHLLASIERHARDRPDAVAIRFIANGQERDYTYGDFWREANRFSSHLAAGQYDPGAVVLIVLKHSVDLYFAFIGAMIAGLTPSFLPFPTPKQDSNLYWKSHEALFKRVRPAAILTYADNIEPINKVVDLDRVAVIDVADVATTDIDRQPANYSDDDIALLQHSSGTTGQKKGVVLTFGQVAAQIASYAQSINLTQDNVVVSWLPLYHDMGLFTAFLMPMTIGSKIVSLDAFEWVGRPTTLLDYLGQENKSLCWLPNFAFHHIVKNSADGRSYDLAGVQAFIGCSEPCKPATYQGFQQHFANSGVSPQKLKTCYAMAETVFAVTQSPAQSEPRTLHIDMTALDGSLEVVVVDATYPSGRGFLSNGAPIDGIEVRLLVADGTTIDVTPGASHGRVGEVMVRGPFVFSGYYNNKEDSDAAFLGEWYKTGDIGFVNGGELFICGRKKEIMIVHGKNYYSNDIEEAVNLVPGIKPGRAVAISLFNDRTQSEEVVVIAEVDAADASASVAVKREVKRSVMERLELSVHSVEVVAPGWLIKTTSGKISRGENTSKYKTLLESRRG